MNLIKKRVKNVEIKNAIIIQFSKKNTIGVVIINLIKSIFKIMNGE